MTRPLICACVLAGGLWLSAPASAQLIADSDEPIDITSDSVEFVDDVTTWSGNVRALQGEAILTASRLVATLSESGAFQTITALGGVRYSNGKEAVAGEHALYDAGQRSITISDNVVLTQGETVMTGGTLVYWLDTGRITFNAQTGERIRGIFHTKSGAPQL
jgi:lipopolysaccharide export system protein LptA